MTGELPWSRTWVGWSHSLQRTGDLGSVLTHIAHYHEAEVSRLLEHIMRAGAQCDDRWWAREFTHTRLWRA
jgi:hypothetical protein